MTLAAHLASPASARAQTVYEIAPQQSLEPKAVEPKAVEPRAARPEPAERSSPPPAEPVARGAVPSTPGAAVRPAKGPVGEVVKELRSGPLLIHGNYCGIGNRPGKPPIDLLDAACMRHDACTKTGQLPSCACDDRLRVEATTIAEDPKTPADIKTVAAATATSMALLVCKITPRAAAGPRSP